MKFRLKYPGQSQSLLVENLNSDQTIAEIKNSLNSLNADQFRLSLNGRDPLNESQTIAQCGLVTGDTIYVLSETKKTFVDRPLRLDEVRRDQIYPIVVDRLFESTQPKTDFDFIVVVLHALMLESGFEMDAENNYDLNPSKKSTTFYVIRYRHKLCPDQRSRCSLAIMKTDSLITIDGVLSSISQACGKLSFHIGNYLYTQKETLNLNSTFPYRDLGHLSRLFKDNLAHRLLCKLLEESGQRSSTTLIGLPNEIKLRIAKKLPIKSLLNLQLTCRDIFNTLNDNLLWHDLCHRDFSKKELDSITQMIDSNSQEKNWYQIYRFNYAQRQAMRRPAMNSPPVFRPTILPFFAPAHRVVLPDPINPPAPNLHPFPSTIYRSVPTGIFPVQPSPSPSNFHSQTPSGSKWVVIFAATTMIPFPPGFHPIWLG